MVGVQYERGNNNRVRVVPQDISAVVKKPYEIVNSFEIYVGQSKITSNGFYEAKLIGADDVTLLRSSGWPNEDEAVLGLIQSLVSEYGVLRHGVTSNPSRRQIELKKKLDEILTLKK